MVNRAIKNIQPAINANGQFNVKETMDSKTNTSSPNDSKQKKK
jgi:hypothetical protein